jgi:Zn-dependent peptidase ImmA (M78 family)
LKGIDLPHQMNFPNFDVDRYGGPVEAARLLRATWQLPRGRINNLAEVVEVNGGIIVMCDLSIAVIDGVSQRTTGLPHLFFLDKTKPTDRCRFTLAHEIGHMVMHSIPSPNAEKEADAFAAEFLMPEKEIAPELKDLTLQGAMNLKLKWRTSAQSLIYRAHSIGAISASRYKSLCVRISQLGYRKNEPNPLAPEYPKMLRWIIDHYLNERGYSVAELSEAALATESEFRRDYLDEATMLRVI